MPHESKQNQRADCSVIGLGAMGATVAKRLVAQGNRTVVWNRTEAKCAPLESAGATVVATAAEALGAAPITLIVLSDTAVAIQILRDLNCDLSGRVVLNFCSGTREDSDRFGSLVQDCGGQYLRGSITSYPRNVGHPDSCFIYSGDAAAFEENRVLLAGLSGEALLLSETDSLALGAAVTIQAFVAMGGFYEAIAAGARLGADPNQLVTNLHKASRFLFLDAIEDAARRIELQDFNGEQATIDTHVSHVEGLLHSLKSRDVQTPLLNAFLDAIKAAQALGYGPEDISATTKAL